MFTLKYKNWYINGYIDRPDCFVCLPSGGLWCTCKSLHAAKIAISKAHTWVRG